MDLTLEDLGRKGFKMYQAKDGFRFGTDTVLLSWFTASFIKAQKKTRALELGSNCGAATLLLAARRDLVNIDALEIDSDAARIMRKNVDINDLHTRVFVFEGDVRALPDELKQKQYDIVFMNPPFYKVGKGPETSRIGRYEDRGTLEDFIRSASSRLIPSSGIMTVVMTASRVPETFVIMDKYGIKPLKMIAVHPLKDRPASVALIAGRKTEAFTSFEITDPLILNETDPLTGKTKTAKRIMEIYEEEHTDCFI